MENVLGILNSLEMNELHRAVQENRLEGVQYLIENGADIADTIDGGQTPLHLACSLDLPHITKELLKNKCRDELRHTINAKTVDSCMTALHLALTKNSLENARLLLSYGAQFDIRDNDNASPQSLSSDKRISELFWSIEKIFNAVASVASQLILDALDSCAPDDLAATMYAHDSQNRTALQMAMAKFDLDRVGKIIDFRMKTLKQNPWQPGANLDGLMRHSKATRFQLNRLDKYCPKSEDLMFDSCFKKIIVDLLNEAHEFLEAYKEQRDPSLNDQPLLIMLEESLEFFGSSETSKFDENVRIIMMLCKGVEFAVSMLKICILAPMQVFMKVVYTSELLDTVRRNDFATVKKCLTGNPNLSQKDTYNYRPLRHAFKHDNFEMAKMLLRLGADPTIDSGPFDEPLLLFSLRCMKVSMNLIEPEVVQLIFDRVSDDKLFAFVNSKAWKNGESALHWAARESNVAIAQFLMSRGAIYCAKGARGSEPKVFANDFSGIRALMEFADRSFAQARNGQTKELIRAIKKSGVISLLAVAGTRDEKGHTLGQVAELAGHVETAEQIRGLMCGKEIDHYRRNAVDFLRNGTRFSL